jgi:molybdate transport system substrate-binding protein
VYAVGRLAIFAPRGSPLVVDERLEGLSRLAKAGGVTRFAIANPDVAPYGRAAEAVLRKRGLWDVLRSQLVLGDSITQAAQFATTGNAVGGLVASLGTESWFRRAVRTPIPAADHSPSVMDGLLKRAGAVAIAFYAFVQEMPRAPSSETRPEAGIASMTGRFREPARARQA